MLIDSHCHLHLLDLSTFENDLSQVLVEAIEAGVEHFLCVSVDLEDYSKLCQIAENYPAISISVGLHPNSEVAVEPDVEMLCKLASHPACIAIGETGLDYYRVSEKNSLENQRNRFRTHIKAALSTNKPIIIHTRQAAEDTLELMKEEKAKEVGGVMHCFGESWEIAEQALEQNFYISFSGIITFKNAEELRKVAMQVPLDRILIETDCPFLAPVPYRGKQNHPALVKYVALMLSELHQVSYEEIAKRTTDNFYRCFNLNSKK